jgi:Arc/MetJ-type ribon-helix-helix transcriptional regulator
MTRKGFKGVPIPVQLYQRLSDYVRHSNGYYVTVSEVVREALRTYLRKAST